MDRDTASPRPRSSNRLTCGILLFTALATVFSAVLWFWIWPTAAVIENRWRQASGLDPEVDFPPHEANKSALNLEQIVVPLGIEIAPAKVPGRMRPATEEHYRFQTLGGTLRGYLGRIRTRQELLEVPPEVEAFLREAESRLAQVAEHLATAEPPRWNFQWREGMAIPLPNLVDHLSLHQLLLAASVDAAGRDNPEESRRWLEAAWRLRQSLEEDPMAIRQMIALAEMEDELAVLRVLPFPLPGWSDRLAGLPLRQRAERALFMDAWLLVVDLQAGRLEQPLTASRGLLMSPMPRHGVAAVVDSTDYALDRLRQEDLRILDTKAFNQEVSERTPRWNRWGHLLAPNFLSVPVKAAHLELQAEITRLALQAREMHRSEDLDGLRALQGTRPSPVRGIDIVVRVEPDLIVIEGTGDVALDAPNPLPSEVRISRSP